MRQLGFVAQVVHALKQREQFGTLGFAGLVERLCRFVEEFIGETAGQTSNEEWLLHASPTPS